VVAGSQPAGLPAAIGRHRWIRIPSSRKLFVWGTLALLIYLVAGPLLMLLIASGSTGQGRLPLEDGLQLSLDNYLRILGNPATHRILVNTGVFAVGGLAVCFPISIFLAWLIERTDLPLGRPLSTMLVATLGIPSFILAMAWGLMLNPVNGLINVAIRGVFGVQGTGPLNVYTLIGVIVVQGLTLVPVTFLLLAGAFRSMDSSLEEAASMSGASHGTILRRITLPLMLPAIVGALVYQFVYAVQSFDVPFILGLRAGVHVLSTRVWSEVSLAPGGIPNYGTAATYGVLLMAMAAGPLIAYVGLLRRPERFATIRGGGHRQRRVSLGRFRFPALGVVVTFIVITFVLPAFILVWTSLQPYYATPSPASLARITTAAYGRMLDSDLLVPALLNTVFVAGASAFGATVLGLAVSWIIVRSGPRTSGIVQTIAFIPHGFPGVIVGLSVMLIYLTLPLGVYGTSWIIVIAFLIHFITITTRALNAAVAQIGLQMEEAAEIHGASWFYMMRRVVLPLAAPSMLNAFALVFLLSLSSLDLPLMLHSPSSPMLTVQIWSSWDHGDAPVAAALGVVTVTIAVALSLLVRRSGAFGAAFRE
jgi:iron(III) transport system permease protein